MNAVLPQRSFRSTCRSLVTLTKMEADRDRVLSAPGHLFQGLDFTSPPTVDTRNPRLPTSFPPESQCRLLVDQHSKFTLITANFNKVERFSGRSRRSRNGPIKQVVTVLCLLPFLSVELPV